MSILNTNFLSFCSLLLSLFSAYSLEVCVNQTICENCMTCSDEEEKKLNKFLRSSLVSFLLYFSPTFVFSRLDMADKFFLFSLFCSPTSHCCVVVNCYFFFGEKSVWEVFESCQYEKPFFFIPTKRWRIWFKKKVKRDKKVFFPFQHFTFQKFFFHILLQRKKKSWRET